MRKSKHYFLYVIVALMLALNTQAQAGKGKIIFTDHCASCHNINKVITGPALNGVEQRHSVDWIRRFVRSSQTFMKSGDKDALALYEKFNHITMPDHPDLTDNDITNVLAYIKSESKDITKEKPPFARPPGHRRLTYTPLSWEANKYLLLGYLGTVALLIIVLLMAVQVKHWQRLQTEEGNTNLLRQ